MPVTDPIADMLTRLRNANTAFKPEVKLPHSKVKAEIARVLTEEGYISAWEQDEDQDGHPCIKVTMKYIGEKRRARVITGIKRVSKPGLRVYAGRSELPRVLGGLGIAIISTPRGIMTDRTARKSGVGGEVLAYVW